MAYWKPFKYEVLSNSCAVVTTIDMANRRVELYYVGTAEEAEDICSRLNATVAELVGDEGGAGRPSYDSEMGQGGAAYNDVMFGDGGE